jgi:hypothetical protein
VKALVADGSVGSVELRNAFEEWLQVGCSERSAFMASNAVCLLILSHELLALGCGGCPAADAATSFVQGMMGSACSGCSVCSVC